MKLKNEVYVKVDTRKQAKKLKKVLEMFGERNFSDEYNVVFDDCIGKAVHFWKGLLFARCPLDGISDDKSKVSIKELRNILAKEHLKAGDVCLFDDRKGFKSIGVFDKYSEEYKDFLVSKVPGKDSVRYGFYDFLRYATDEEKALFNTKKELEVGKWYKIKSINAIFFLTEIKGDNRKNKGYGILNDDWYDNRDAEYYMGHAYEVENFVEATAEEVEQALIEEAKKRGFKDNFIAYNYCSNVLCGDRERVLLDSYGKWAEVVKPETKTINVTEILLKIGDLEDQIQKLKKLL